MTSTERVRAYLRLHLADGVGAVTFKRLVEAFGDVAEACGASAGMLQRVKGVGEKTAAAIAAVGDEQIDAELAAATEARASIVCLEDDAYPPQLRNIHDPPAVLYVRGELRKSDAVSIGVVGSRNCTHYGLEQAERFAQLLSRAGFVVISGGARGIDTAAHRGTLTAGGRTIAVMGCGLCHPYPPENAPLYEQIVAAGGAVISELPMRTAVLAGNFPTRNRIISGMSLGVLVVEAARRSGALLTAKEADEQGRPVFAVPGRVDSPLSQGTNELIRNGVTLVQDLDDILEQLGEVGRAMAPAEEPAPPAPASMDDAEKRCWEALEAGPLGLDELVRTTGLTGGKATAAMTMLVLKGAVSQQPGNIFARKKPKAKPMLFS